MAAGLPPADRAQLRILGVARCTGRRSDRFRTLSSATGLPLVLRPFVAMVVVENSAGADATADEDEDDVTPTAALGAAASGCPCPR